MMQRRSKGSSVRITSGPGVLSKALGIDLRLYGEDLTGEKVWLEYADIDPGPTNVVKTTRIGVNYAGEDAQIPWRFYVKNNIWVSKI
jgi:DNA-3-methyladenine glycosylase